MSVTGRGQTPEVHGSSHWSWSDARGTLDKSPSLVDAVFLGPELDCQYQGPDSVVGLKKTGFRQDSFKMKWSSLTKPS